MCPTMHPVEALVAEFAQRGIAARSGGGGTEPLGHARINNVDVEIHFGDGGVTWQGNDGRLHRRGPHTAAPALADAIIDSLLNPA